MGRIFVGFQRQPIGVRRSPDPSNSDELRDSQSCAAPIAYLPPTSPSMVLQPHSEPEFTVVSTTNNAGFAPYSGAFFPGAAGFTIGGGNFTSNVPNNIYNPPPEQPAAFRTILLGDINLLKEIRMDDESGVVGRQSQRTSARRMYYSMKVEWRQHITKYESILHPKIMQLYGLMSTKGLRGVVFHNEMIPWGQFYSRFEYSNILRAYIFGYSVRTSTIVAHLGPQY
ncbi:hypothetical protein B0H14DRAFT_2723188 [Mycena olivaceomarginata]|nr:hypothetical protein B0H14DRAFT_2723188 [Mycena olivaceomarginata]